MIIRFVNKHIRQAENKLRNNVAEKKIDKECSIVEQLLFKQQLQPEDISTLLMDSLLLGTLAVCLNFFYIFALFNFFKLFCYRLLTPKRFCCIPLQKIHESRTKFTKR